MPDLKYFLLSRIHLRTVFRIFPIMGLVCLLAAAAPVAAVSSVDGQNGIDMLSTLLMVLLTTITVAALIIIGLVHWSHKQEHIDEMMHFCMKYLFNSEDETERCASARALGRAKDVGALLVLLDISMDEEEAEAVRKAASEALHEMSLRFRKQQNLINDLELHAEQGNYREIITIVRNNFEHDKKRYVQSAYLIGRLYLRLERYVEAREWLTTAEYRNRKFNLYGNRIRYLIQICNTRLLEEADDSFKKADYQEAKEHYAVLDHGLSDMDRQRCAVYLRMACVYCKLKDYRNADQSVLQALEHNHETELALTLASLLQEVLGLGKKGVESQGKLESIKSAIDERASVIMSALMAQDFGS